jgi:hypothetical protein
MSDEVMKHDQRLVTGRTDLLASLSPKERSVLIDLLVRVIQANEIYIRPGAGGRADAK